MLLRLIQVILLFALCSCKPAVRPEPITALIGSWYGFYPLYYAREKQLDVKHGVRLKTLEPSNITILRRSYVRSEVDLVATSMLEFTNATTLNQQRLIPLLITDYSKGGDVVIARKTIQATEELKGKRVAVPSQGIGEYILSLIFDDPNPMQFINQKKLPETECARAFAENEIDACVTYPPISTHLLENPNLHTIYTSEQHPQRIFDVIWIRSELDVNLHPNIQAMWFDVIDLIEANPLDYYQFVADISSVSLTSVEQAMRGIQLVNKEMHDQLLANSDRLAEDFVVACSIAKGENCQQFRTAFKETP